jgi:hypothetical protein
MRTIFYILLFIGISVSLTSCREDFVFKASTGDLAFSKDTVYLDTVFTNIGSSTYTLKVYNKSNTDIKIPKIQLGKGLLSKYRMTVDGMTGEDNDNNGIGDGQIFDDVELLAKDSMYIFIEVTADVAIANPTDFLYTDQILFDSGALQQKVELVTLIQDAYFLYPKRFSDGTTETIPIGDENAYGFYLDENDPVNGNEYVWGNDKPYVVYGYGAVPTGKTLTVQAGARVHFHADSGLIVGNGGSLKVQGAASNSEALENEVIFEGDRLEPGFSDVPGQWGTIWLTAGSTANEIDHLTIRNAIIGLLIDSNDGNYMTIKNTQIYNSTNMGIYAKTAKIKGENIVINYAGQYALACTLGGSYEFKHCTFNNNWSNSKQLAVLVDNYYVDNTTNQQVAFDLEQADFKNCIIFGSNQVELFLDKSSISPETNWTSPTFTKCQIRFNNTNNQFTNNPDYAFINDSNEIKKNGNPDFLDIYTNKLVIGDHSDVKDFGDDLGINLDVIGTTRVVTGGKVDIGAYQHIIFPD